MEKIKEKLNNDPNFEALRHQVELIKKEEMIKKENGEDYDTHFDIIDPSKLTDEDLLIFDKSKKLST